MKRKRIFAACILGAVVFMFLKNNKRGEPDRTGSWSQINQAVERGQNRKKIVGDSQFKLGEKYVRGSWHVPDGGKEDYYEIRFGTYPSIDGSTVAIPMAVEFARQHLGFSDQDANDFASFSTTHYAYENLIMKRPNTLGIIRSLDTFLDESHPVDLIIVTEPSDEEIAMAEKENVEMTVTPIC